MKLKFDDLHHCQITNSIKVKFDFFIVQGGHGFAVTLHPACPMFHRALKVRHDNTLQQCVDCDETVTNKASYEYICVWERIKAQLESTACGPQLRDYYQSMLVEVFSEEQCEYSDFHSGSIFKEVVDQLGGLYNVMDDIFLSLSADGVQPFKSDDYSCWPVVATVLNLPPSERYKSKNLLPLLIIPGPTNPKNLTSFIEPFLDELESLSRDGRMVRLYSGECRRVRVHLLFVLADLPAMKKLTHLKGHNGLVPCRFCVIRGVYTSHVYFPSVIESPMNAASGRKRRRKSTKTLWDPARLPIRTDKSIRDAYSDLKIFSLTGKRKEIEYMLRNVRFATVNPSPLLKCTTLHAFASFPPDIMHLCFENIAKDIVDIWVHGSGCSSDLAYLGSSRSFQGVNRTLQNCGLGISSFLCRKPRGLHKKGKWKAAEWKYFVLSTSLVALHEWVPDSVLSGWELFVKLVHRVCQWKLSEELVEQVELLSQEFFRHFTEQYYQTRPDRIYLCKYVYYLLLHLADSIRQCGPISLLAQWSMENFAGQLKKVTHAKDRFAEVAREKLKHQSAAALYSRRSQVQIPFLFEEENECSVAPNLRAKSTFADLDSFEIQQPCHLSTVDDAQEKLFPGLRNMLKRYYVNAMNISSIRAAELLRKHPEVVIWDRLYDEKTSLLIQRCIEGLEKIRRMNEQVASSQGIFGKTAVRYVCPMEKQLDFWSST